MEFFGRNPAPLGIPIGIRNTVTGWWFQTFFVFHNNMGESFPLTNMFQDD